MTSKNKSKSFNILESYLYLQNVLDNDLTKVLSEQDYNDHVIDLTENREHLYMLLYNLS